MSGLEYLGLCALGWFLSLVKFFTRAFHSQNYIHFKVWYILPTCLQENYYTPANIVCFPTFQTFHLKRFINLLRFLTHFSSIISNVERPHWPPSVHRMHFDPSHLGGLHVCSSFCPEHASFFFSLKNSPIIPWHWKHKMLEAGLHLERSMTICQDVEKMLAPYCKSASLSTQLSEAILSIPQRSLPCIPD